VDSLEDIKQKLSCEEDMIKELTQGSKSIQDHLQNVDSSIHETIQSTNKQLLQSIEASFSSIKSEFIRALDKSFDEHVLIPDLCLTITKILIPMADFQVATCPCS
jgi:uncharacterized membrane-anchored protein